ncbi:hypothetical protein SVEN_6732 [Streptomyces venezuelae ATCC 10712]|uniref:Uncharacterized protein n=1 Tax=Streptomyces venezuelae (strain ATCC 10712 / CBS 650.69 / DSM 40230 / JCM 4526 / NBRC 13096 / PD 04745) TaxID=953739 RepID=F2RHS4_STRVP|nr:hypothetical protein SVEN_6732 [Streptomyces venezuelae ATCC 10712]
MDASAAEGFREGDVRVRGRCVEKEADHQGAVMRGRCRDMQVKGRWRPPDSVWKHRRNMSSVSKMFRWRGPIMGLLRPLEKGPERNVERAMTEQSLSKVFRQGLLPVY